jgi:hypothetical protein
VYNSVLHSPNLHGLHLQQIVQISLSTQHPRSLSHSAHGHEWRSLWSGQSFKPSRSGYRLHLAGQPSSFVQGHSLLSKVYSNHTIGQTSRKKDHLNLVRHI